MKWHPDKNKEDPQAQDRFHDLSAAYEVCFLIFAAVKTQNDAVHLYRGCNVL